jgi:hypothetical protein
MSKDVVLQVDAYRLCTSFIALVKCGNSVQLLHVLDPDINSLTHTRLLEDSEII